MWKHECVKALFGWNPVGVVVTYNLKDVITCSHVMAIWRELNPSATTFSSRDLSIAPAFWGSLHNLQNVVGKHLKPEHHCGPTTGSGSSKNLASHLFPIYYVAPEGFSRTKGTLQIPRTCWRMANPWAEMLNNA